MTKKNELIFLKPTYTTLGLYELEFNSRNIRKLSKKGAARLKKKILENVYEPLKVWKQGNVVLSGNQRLSVMRSLVESEGYDIQKVNVAIYDVDERTAKFIEYSDNEHEGQYDLEKLVEEFDAITEFDLKDVLDPKLVKKIESKILPETDEDLDLDDEPSLDIVETNTTDIIISSVPKVDSILFYDTIDSVGKCIGSKNQWQSLKVILKVINRQLAEKSTEELKEYLSS